jgi:hypothetical protein
MSIRRRDDSVKPGKGIDGTLGEDYSRKHAVDPWNSNPEGNSNRVKAGKYTDNTPPLRNEEPYDATEGSYSILDNVENQSSDSGNRKIRSRGQP